MPCGDPYLQKGSHVSWRQCGGSLRVISDHSALRRRDGLVRRDSAHAVRTATRLVAGSDAMWWPPSLISVGGTLELSASVF